MQTRELALAVRRIAGDHVEVVVFQCDQATLVVMQLTAHAVLHRKRLVLGQDRRAGISLFLGRVKILVIALGGNLSLSGLHLCLLQAEKICILRGKVIAKALAKTGAQAVDVPGNQFHASSVGIE